VSVVVGGLVGCRELLAEDSESSLQLSTGLALLCLASKRGLALSSSLLLIILLSENVEAKLALSKLMANGRSKMLKLGDGRSNFTKSLKFYHLSARTGSLACLLRLLSSPQLDRLLRLLVEPCLGGALGNSGLREPLAVVGDCEGSSLL
jgi:hypothetical protein